MKIPESLLNSDELKNKELELKETHISWVFLAEEYVYKIKKPVNFGFLDFSTLEKRKHFCEQEIKINKRLCPEVYLGVVPITTSREIIDYAVKMLRLPEEAHMPNLLKENKVTAEHISKIASKLSEFHSNAEQVEGFGYDTIKFNWDENFEQTEKFIGETVEAETFNYIRTKIEDFLENKKQLFEKRERDGKIKDCHGDMHMGNIFITNKINIFDAIEFNERFRYGDVASEVAFLAMDLDFNSSKELSDHFVKKYLEYSKDEDLLNILDFYKCYRAYVRAKINCFQLEQGKTESRELAKKYFELAYEYAKLI